MPHGPGGRCASGAACPCRRRRAGRRRRPVADRRLGQAGARRLAGERGVFVPCCRTGRPAEDVLGAELVGRAGLVGVLRRLAASGAGSAGVGRAARGPSSFGSSGRSSTSSIVGLARSSCASRRFLGALDVRIDRPGGGLFGADAGLRRRQIRVSAAPPAASARDIRCRLSSRCAGRGRCRMCAHDLGVDQRLRRRPRRLPRRPPGPRSRSRAQRRAWPASAACCDSGCEAVLRHGTDARHAVTRMYRTP